MFADLVGSVRADMGSPRVRALIAANPALAALERRRPQVLPAVVERILLLLDRPEGGVRRRLARPPASAPLGTDDRYFISENPALETIYKDSPEAALDLLRLIREAASN